MIYGKSGMHTKPLISEIGRVSASAETLRRVLSELALGEPIPQDERELVISILSYAAIELDTLCWFISHSSRVSGIRLEDSGGIKEELIPKIVERGISSLDNRALAVLVTSPRTMNIVYSHLVDVFDAPWGEIKFDLADSIQRFLDENPGYCAPFAARAYELTEFFIDHTVTKTAASVADGTGFYPKDQSVGLALNTRNTSRYVQDDKNSLNVWLEGVDWSDIVKGFVQSPESDDYFLERAYNTQIQEIPPSTILNAFGREKNVDLKMIFIGEVSIESLAEKISALCGPSTSRMKIDGIETELNFSAILARLTEVLDEK